MRLTSIFLISMLLIMLPMAASAGDLTPPGPPDSQASAMYTIEDLYNYLRYGTSVTKRPGPFRQSLNKPTVGSGYTLDDLISVSPPIDNATGAQPQHVKAGKVFWGLSEDGWGLQTGTLVKRSGVLLVSSTDVPEGHYDTIVLDTVDPDLKPDNIRAGIVIFGIVGNPNVMNTAEGDASAADIQLGRTAWVKGQAITGTAEVFSMTRKTGQTTSYVAGDDGDLQKGAAASGPRFSDNGDGTVTDNLTGLIWLKDANYFGTKMWNEAIDAVNALSEDWRLPNVKELQSLLNFEYADPALSPAAPFLNVQSAFYWTSTTCPAGADQGWEVSLANGQTGVNAKSVENYVWAVKGEL